MEPIELEYEIAPKHRAVLSGRCTSAAERGSGRVYHLVRADVADQIARQGFSLCGKALCGAQPGRLSAVGWTKPLGNLRQCPRCAKRAETAVAAVSKPQS